MLQLFSVSGGWDFPFPPGSALVGVQQNLMFYSKYLFKILQFIKFMVVFSFKNCFYHGQWGDLELLVFISLAYGKIELIFQFLFIIVLVQSYSELRILNCSWILAIWLFSRKNGWYLKWMDGYSMDIDEMDMRWIFDGKWYLIQF